MGFDGVGRMPCFCAPLLGIRQWFRLPCVGTSSDMCAEAAKRMERVTGIEPALPAWEAGVLPLNYTRAAGLPQHDIQLYSPPPHG